MSPLSSALTIHLPSFHSFCGFSDTFLSDSPSSDSHPVPLLHPGLTAKQPPEHLPLQTLFMQIQSKP